MDELLESVADIYEAKGKAGLQALPGIGKSIAAQIAVWLQEEEVLI